MLILVLAANTAFADFPRLSWFLARDHYMPHQFSFRGDRLAFSTGISTLGVISAADRLRLQRGHPRADPALRDRRLRGVHLLASRDGQALVDEAGARLAVRPADQHDRRPDHLLVAVIQSVTQFTHGAWTVIVLIPLQVYILWRINAHYTRVAEQLAIDPDDVVPTGGMPEPILVVPVPGLNKAVARTIRYAAPSRRT